MKANGMNRLIAAIVLASALLMPACSPDAPPSPTATADPLSASFVPALASEAQTARIAVHTIGDYNAFDDTMQRLNKALAAAGQNVAFEVQYLKYVEGGNIFLDKVMAELTAGKPSADAYSLDFVNSKVLFDAGLTMDVTALVRQNAPVFCSRYGRLFPERLTGIPTMIVAKPIWYKTALMLRDDFATAGGDVTDIAGLLKFLDKTIVDANKPCSVLANPGILVPEWALEQGYYELSMFGVDGYLYALQNDPACAPVTLESIPGFAEFYDTLMQYYKNKALSMADRPEQGRECAGFVKNLGEYYVTSAYSSVSWVEGSYSAHALNPGLPSYFIDEFYAAELAVPALCPMDKAAALARFAEWLYASQENYNTVIYGERGRDFNTEGGRYEPLVEGTPIKPGDYRTFQKLYMAWPGTQLLSNTDFFRLPAGVPANVDRIMADGIAQNRRFPLAAYIRTDRATLDKVLKTGDELKAEVRQRNEILNKLLYPDVAAYSRESLDRELETLSYCKNGWIIEQYKAILKGIMENKQ